MVARVSSYQATVPSQYTVETANSHGSQPDVGQTYIPSPTQPQTQSRAWRVGAAVLWASAAAGFAMSAHILLAPPLLVSVAIFSAFVLAGVIVFAFSCKHRPILTPATSEGIRNEAERVEAKDEARLKQLRGYKHILGHPNTLERDLLPKISEMVKLVKEDWEAPDKKEEAVKELCAACETLINKANYRNEIVRDVLEKMLSFLKSLPDQDRSRQRLEKVTLRLVLTEILSSDCRLLPDEEEAFLTVLISERTHDFEGLAAEITGPGGLVRGGPHYQKTLEFLYQTLQKQPPCEDVNNALAIVRREGVKNANMMNSAQQLAEGMPQTITI